jgi:hypothetical protein
MKRTLWLILLNALVLSLHTQISSAQQGDINELKSNLTQLFTSSISKIEQYKTCLSSVQDQAGFDNCLNQIEEPMRNELRTVLAGSTSAPALNYSEKTQQSALQALNKWTQGLKNSINCIDQVQTTDNDSLDQIKACINNNNTIPAK